VVFGRGAAWRTGVPAGAAVALLLSLAQPVAAADTACRGEVIATGLVKAVSEPTTLLLDGGQTVRLAGLDVPAALTGESYDPQREAFSFLTNEVQGRSVQVVGQASDPDRYGRLRGHVFAVEKGLEPSVAHVMLARGLGRVSLRAGDRACAAELLAVERQARAGGRGLWAHARYAVLRADDPAAVLASRGTFALVEGRVISVRESGATIYVNFSRKWSEDFTVTIAKRNERMLKAAGLDLKRLERRTVRVRGYVEERGGPWIEVTLPEQIEIVGEKQ
jgi:endonuclease YncB( thermonuclease family)